MKRLCLFIGLLLGNLATGKAQMPENTLTAEQKIAGLSALWAEAKYNDAFFDNIGTEKWDSRKIKRNRCFPPAPSQAD